MTKAYNEKYNGCRVAHKPLFIRKSRLVQCNDVSYTSVNGSCYSIFTCVSVSMRDVATSKRFGRDRYLFFLNCNSNSKSCWLVKAVLGRLVLPRMVGCWWPGRTRGSENTKKLRIKFHIKGNVDKQHFWSKLVITWQSRVGERGHLLANRSAVQWPVWKTWDLIWELPLKTCWRMRSKEQKRTIRNWVNSTHECM